MSTQLIDFESGSVTTGDSGERLEEESIKPYVAGERVQAAVFDRPLENLRARTEELRKKVEDLLYRADADKWIITGGNSVGAVTGPTSPFPTVTWTAGATNKFTISEAIVVQPLMAPIQDLFASKLYTFGGVETFNIFPKNNSKEYDVYFDYQHANSARIIWETATLSLGVTCVVTIEGEPDHILRIKIRDDSSTTAANVITELNTVLGGLMSPPFDYTSGGPGTTILDLADIAGDEDVTLEGTYSRELHHIPTTAISNFFLATTLADDGDGIGIWFEELVDSDLATFGGRRQATTSTPSSGGGAPPNTSITVDKLFKFSTEPEKISGAIPLCRRIGTSLVFVDGTVVAAGQTATFGGEGSIDALLAAYTAHKNGTADKHAAGDITSTPYSWIAASNVGAVINEIVDDLALTGAGVSGASRVGNEAIDTGSAHSETAVGGTVHAHIDSLAGWIANRAHKTAGEKITGKWDHIGSSSDDTDYECDAYVKHRLDAGRSGGASGPGITIAKLETGLIDRGDTSSPYMWGNPRAACNRASIGAVNLDKQIMMNVRRDHAKITEAGMLSRVIVSCGRTNGNIYVKDAYDINGTTTTISVAAHLPAAGADWRLLSICACGSGIFGVLAQNVTPAPNQTYRVHQFTMSHTSGGGYAITPRPGMPATGVALDGTGPEGLGTALCSNIIAKDSFTLYTLNGWNASSGGKILSAITTSDGSVSYGRGDCPSSATCWATGGLTMDSSSLFFTTYDNPPGSGIPRVAAANLFDLTLGRGGFPIDLGATIAQYCVDLCHDGSMLFMPLIDGNVEVFCLDGTAQATLTAGTIAIGNLFHCCADGRNVWFSEYVAGNVNLIGVDAARVRSGAPDTTMDFAGARKYFITRDSEACSAGSAMGRLLYDGDSVLVGLDNDTGQSLTGKFAKLTCATDRT